MSIPGVSGASYRGLGFSPYTSAELDQIVACLHSSRSADDIRHEVEECAKEYQRHRDQFDRYYKRTGKTRELLSQIELIEKVIGLLDLMDVRVGTGWSKALTSELLKPVREEKILWAYPWIAELTRRSLASLKGTLEQNLDHANPYAVINRKLPAGKRISVPGRNDKAPERRFIGSLLELYSYATGLSVANVPIGNSTQSNKFLNSPDSVWTRSTRGSPTLPLETMPDLHEPKRKRGKPPVRS